MNSYLEDVEIYLSILNNSEYDVLNCLILIAPNSNERIFI